MKVLVEITKEEYECFKSGVLPGSIYYIIGLIANGVIVEERPKGHWIFTPNNVWICSQCQTNPLRATGYVPGQKQMKEQWNFCNICGAKMEADNENG